jgi:hypothetical protein
MKLIILTLCLIFSISLLGQRLSKKDKVYKPKDFNEALTQLNKITPDSTKLRIKSMTEPDFLAQTHLSIGMWIRNYWLYNRYLFGIVVTKSDLWKDLYSKGLFNNDDMSEVILRSFYRQLNHLEINLNQQLEDIHQWYVNMNDPKWRLEQDSIVWANQMKEFNIDDTIAQHVYYDRNWLGETRKDNVILAKVIEKSEKQLKIEIISFGTESNKDVIFKEIECQSGNCWITPYFWKKINEFEEW